MDGKDYVVQAGHGMPGVVKKYGNDNYINVTLPFDKEVMPSRTNIQQMSLKNHMKKYW